MSENLPKYNFSYALPAATPAPTNKTISVDILTVKLPEVCPNPFYLTKGFYHYELPEVMMCNLEVNPDSHSYFCTIVHTLMLDLANEGTKGQKALAVLTSEKFQPFAFPAKVKTPEGEQSQIFQAAGRKLSNQESYLLLNHLFLESSTKQVDMTPEQAKQISAHGVALVEIADENNYLPFQSGYDWRRVSQINTVTLQ